ncbi:MAG: hypothetical protein NZ937_03970 [Armatimonadetes bacterium]|nr:hypothetical protein [Armatimonadota bacterium]MCS7192125.1 hypothetical protein [Armatimonadota bacterium]
MWVAGQKDMFKDYKIDKRAQILITAYTWINADRNVHGAYPCNRLTYSVYNCVGLSLPYELERYPGAPPNHPPNQFDSTVADTKDGSLLFYTMSNFPDCAHVGIKDGQDIIDINCALGHTNRSGLPIVKKHSQSAFRIGPVPPNHYTGVSDPKTLEDLKALDSE